MHSADVVCRCNVLRWCGGLQLHTHTHTHTYTHTHTHTHNTYVYVEYLHANSYTRACVRTNAFTSTQCRTHACAAAHIYRPTSTDNTDKHMLARAHTHRHTFVCNAHTPYAPRSCGRAYVAVRIWRMWPCVLWPCVYGTLGLHIHIHIYV